ncbi:unnamed protein product [Meloidogyne enterolobii]|uniref:Uncharacterized protein n=1 Tax=Meloidogyne enterolobii TaxID=390850 RepID=A0ACB0YE61_MELEN
MKNQVIKLVVPKDRQEVFYERIGLQQWYLHKHLERTTGCKIHVRREGSEMHVVIEVSIKLNLSIKIKKTRYVL